MEKYQTLLEKVMNAIAVVKKFRSSNSLIETPEHQYLLPGFTDLHIHAPQWPQLGKALDIPLEKWLQKYTFPLEAKFKDENFAHFVYEDLVRSLLKAGTTTAVYYGTIHQRSTQILVEKCIEFGQRAVVGKVVMDNPVQCPDYYRDSSTKAALDDTELLSSLLIKLKKIIEEEYLLLLRQDLYQVALMKRYMSWVSWLSSLGFMCKLIVPKVIGSIIMC